MRHVNVQIEAARTQGIEEGRNQKEREWFRWGLFKVVLGLSFPVICGFISLGVIDSFWIGFIVGLILECIPWWIFLFM